MYDLVKKFKLENSISSLYDNLDILVEKDESSKLVPVTVCLRDMLRS